MRLPVVYCYIVTSRATHLDNGHTTCATKNETPALSAPEFIAISQGGHNHPKGGISHPRDSELYEWNENPGKYSVWNKENHRFQGNGFRRNGRKTQENIRFKFKSFKSKWLTLYVRNRFRRKIFGLKWKVYNLPFQKFSLQSSKHFTAKNIPFKNGKF